MADENIIKNVGGQDGVASEATMQKLLAAMEKMAKASGKDPNSQEKRLRDAMGKSLMGNITAIKSTRVGLGSLAKSITPVGKAMDALSKITGVAGDVVGTTAKSVVGFGNELFGASTNLSDFARHIPYVGSALAKLAEKMDDTRNQFTNIATSGAAFSYDMGQFRLSARQAGLDLSEYTSFIRDNSEKMASFGGTVTRGAMQVSRMTDAIGGELRQSLLSMGLNFEEINESMAYYQYVTRAGSRTRLQDETAQAQAAASLTKNMLTLSKLTGKDIRQMKDKLAQEQMDIAFQAEMSKLSKEQRDEMQKALTNAALYGEEAIDAVKREFLGMPPLTENAAIFAATQNELYSQLTDMVKAIRRGDPVGETEDFLRTSMLNYVESLNRNETLLRAGASGLGGTVGQIAEQMNVPADLISPYLDFNEEIGKYTFNMQEFNKVLPEILDNTFGDENETMSEFLDSLAEVRKKLTEYLINPIISMVTPVLKVFTGILSDMSKNGSFFSDLLEDTTPYISAFENSIRNGIEKMRPTFAAFGESIKTAIENLKQGNFSQAFIDVFDGIGAVFSDIWNSPAGQRVADAITNMFQNLINKMEETFVNSWLARIVLGIDREEVAERQRTETGPTTEREAENFGAIIGQALRGSLQSSAIRDDIVSQLGQTLSAQQMEAIKSGIEENQSSFLRAIQGEGIEYKGELLRLINLASSGEASQEQLDLLRDIYNGFRNQGLIEGPEIPKLNKGTNGFKNFGSGTLAILHGREAVVPENSELGQLIHLASADGPRRPTFSDAVRRPPVTPATPAPPVTPATPASPVTSAPTATNPLGVQTPRTGPFSRAMQALQAEAAAAEAATSRPVASAATATATNAARGAGAKGLLGGGLLGAALAAIFAPSSLGDGTIPFEPGPDILSDISNPLLSTGARNSNIRGIGVENFATPRLSPLSEPSMRGVLMDLEEALSDRTPAVSEQSLAQTNELVDSIQTMNQNNVQSTNNSMELQKKLNMIMNDIRTILYEMRDVSKKIETNTRSLGSNVSSGKITNIR